METGNGAGGVNDVDMQVIAEKRADVKAQAGVRGGRDASAGSVRGGCDAHDGGGARAHVAASAAVDYASLSDDAIMRELGHLSAIVRRGMRSIEGAGHAEGLLIHLAMHEDAMADGFATKPLTQVEAAEVLGIRPQSVGPIIRQLEERGLIRRMPDDQDRRAHLLELTAAGRAEAAEARDFQRHYASQALSALSAEEKAALASTVAKVNASLTER